MLSVPCFMSEEAAAPVRMRQHDPERGEILVEWTTGQAQPSALNPKALDPEFEFPKPKNH